MGISSDGELLVSDHEDGTVRRSEGSIVEAVVQPIRTHNNCISDVAVSKDGNRIVSCSIGDDVRLWDGLSGEAIGRPFRRK